MGMYVQCVGSLAAVRINFNLDWECSSLAELVVVGFLLAGTTVLDTETPLGMPCSCS
jgi:hypothetical protein